MKINNVGFEIIKKYEPEAAINPAHDQIFIGDYETSFSKMTDEEKEIMKEDGWFEDSDCWSHFT